MNVGCMKIYKIFKMFFPVRFKNYIRSLIKQYQVVSDEKFLSTVNSYYSKYIETDSLNYEILVNGVKEIKNIPGIICEIGTRRGGSAKWIIDSLVENNDTERLLITIDPYGNIEYDHGDGDIGSNKTVVDYTNKMRNETIPYLYIYALEKLHNFIFLNMEDTEYFERFGDGIPNYSDFRGKTLENNYALVFFDGPHDFDSISKEVNFFNDRTQSGAIYVFDDISNYNHSLLEEELLLKSGWSIFETSIRKISYKKI